MLGFKSAPSSRSIIDTPETNTSKKKKLFFPIVKNIPIITNNKKSDTVTTHTAQKFEFKAPIDAPSQFGNNNTQVNQITGKVDRHPLEEQINGIMNYLPTKSRSLTISYENTDIESKNFCIELKSILGKRGYSNVSLFDHLEIGTPQQPFPITIDTAHYNVSIKLNGH